MGKKKNAYKILVGGQYGKRPLGRPTCRWEHDIKLDLGHDGEIWSGLTWLRIWTSGGHGFN
jgi:hypothetical protein